MAMALKMSKASAKPQTEAAISSAMTAGSASGSYFRIKLKISKKHTADKDLNAPEQRYSCISCYFALLTAAIRSAMRIELTRLRGLALPVPTWSKAVP